MIGKRVLLVLGLLAALGLPLRSHMLPSLSAHAATTVTITGVQADSSSAKIYFDPVPGAQDYRIYDTSAPTQVKYAGLTYLAAGNSCPGQYCQQHFVTQADGVTPVFPYQTASGPTGGPQALSVPATEIEWNHLGDGQPHTLVVEAVNQLGPVPHANLYNSSDNTPLVMPMPASAMLGSNSGPTDDGKVSTNGQGPYTDNPQPLAQSLPIVVQANPASPPIPSRPAALSSFLDTFQNAEGSTLQQVARTDSTTDSFGNLGSMAYTLNAGTPKAWDIEYRQADNADSQPMIDGDHFMDVLFDGATRGVSAPMHTIYGSMSMTPVQTADMSNGHVLHLTMEVDGHSSFRRWMGMDLVPAADPLQAWDPEAGKPINTSDQGLFLEFKPGNCTLDIYTGPVSSTNASPTGTAGGAAHGARLWGQAGSVGGAPIMCWGDNMYDPSTFSGDGLAFDDRSRYDFFISQTHAALFINGRLILQSDIPAGSFPWATGPVKVYYSHYLYHSDADLADLGNYLCYPMNAYWYNDPVAGTSTSQTQCAQAYPGGFGFPHSDERHWDNMGFEVLPASSMPSAGDWSALAAAVAPPPILPPTFANLPPTIGVQGFDNELFANHGAGFMPLSGGILAAPAVVPLPGGEHLYIATGGDHRLWERTDTQPWQVLAAAYCLDNPAATILNATLLVACQGSGHGLFYGTVPLPGTGLPVLAGWSAWGGITSAGPALAVVNGTPTLVVIGQDHRLWWRTASQGWSPLAGTWCTGHPALGGSGSTAYLACHWQDNALWYATNTGAGWSSFVSLGGGLIDGPGIAATASGPVFVVEGLNQGVWERTAGTGWLSLGGGVQHGVSATSG